MSWSPVFPELLRYLKQEHPVISILNVSDFSFPRFRRPPGCVIKKYLLSSGNELTKDHLEPGALVTLGFSGKRLQQSIPEADLRELKSAIESVLASMFADFRPARHFLLGPRIRKSLTTRAEELYAKALGVFSAKNNLLVFVPNGRFPYQKAVELAAKRSGALVHYYERGFRPDSGFYVGSHPTQDRISWQYRAATLAVRKSELTSLSEASSWLKARREPASTVNEFSRAWTSHAKPKEPLEESTTVFFTSSQDEYVSLEGWQGFGWKDQYDAFAAFSRNTTGPKCLRIHPNFLNKSFGHALEEVGRIIWFAGQTDDLTVVWPDDPVNTYDLIDQAERTFVHGSTVGLEASAGSKPVWNSGSAIYDIHADIRNFKPNVHYDEEYFEPWKANPRGSLEIVQALLDADVPFSYGVRTPLWNSATIPLSVRLTNLLLVGSLPYFILLVGRGFSIRANRILIKIVKNLIRNAKVTRPGKFTIK